MKHYYLEIDLSTYPLGYQQGHIRQQYQSVKTILLRSFDDDLQSENQPDVVELVLLVDLRYEFDGPRNLFGIKYGKAGDKDWTILDETAGGEFYEKLAPILRENPKEFSLQQLELFQPLLRDREGNEHTLGNVNN